MPINKVVQGDLLQLFKNGDFSEIIQGCNCFHVQGAGIAGQIARQFPEAFEADKKSKFGDIGKLGTYSSAKTPFGAIINAYTQYRPGKEEKKRLYSSIEKVFGLLNDSTIVATEWCAGIPRIGAGIAGGDWSDINRIIDGVTPKLNIVLVDYIPQRNA